MSMSLQQEFLTSREAAERLGVTDARVRQLCIHYATIAGKNIGKKLGHVWMLTTDDLDKIRALPEFRKKTA
jgi:hypothetical protein